MYCNNVISIFYFLNEYSLIISRGHLSEENLVVRSTWATLSTKRNFFRNDGALTEEDSATTNEFIELLIKRSHSAVRVHFIVALDKCMKIILVSSYLMWKNSKFFVNLVFLKQWKTYFEYLIINKNIWCAAI